MIIKELEIKNYRGIKTLNIPFDQNGAVFYGINGSGKSTVIKAINVLLSQIIDKVSNGRFKNRISIGEDDVSYGHSLTVLTATLILNQDQYMVSKAYDKKKRTSLHVNKTLMEFSNLLRVNLLENPDFELPVFVVYGVNRSVVDIPLRIRKTHSFDRIAAYEKSSAGTDFRVFFEWFRNQEDYENQVRANEDNNYQDKQLQTVREAIYRFMPGFSKLKVERKPKLKMVVTKNNTKLSINQLSDGEKCYIAMIGDLARRMAIANPDAEDPLKCGGIVLIDEIELHLHPEWQRIIVPALRKTFPNIQFIITTHSPQVLG
ncbi:MAG: AAA family ATPase [Syntrophomonas sp.]